MSDKQTVILVIYGAGGHKTEMQRLVSQLTVSNPVALVSLGSGVLNNPALAHYQAYDVRDKHSRLRSLLKLFPAVLKTLFDVLTISRRYKVAGVLSTGPGLCILPMLLFRVVGVKTVFLETFCRFESRSFTGRIMYRIAHRFLIQNRELQSLYPNAEYSGRL